MTSATSDRLQVGALRAQLQRVRLPIGLVLDQVELSADDASILTATRSLTLPRPGDITVRISPQSIVDYLEQQAPGGLSRFEIELENGLIGVKAVARVVFEVPVAAWCRLRVAGGKQLWLDLDRVDVMGVGANRLVEAQLAKINPVLDAAQFPLSLDLTEATIADGFVVIRGTAAP